MTKILIKAGLVDLTPYVKNYRLTYNTLIKGDAINAAGNTTINILNTKAKIEVTFVPADEAQMVEILDAFDTLVVNLEYWDTKTQTQKTGTFATSSPSSDFYTNRNETALFESMSLNLTEL